MARLLLINPSYHNTYGSNEGGLANPVYPVMSLASLAGAAKRRGHEAAILDMSYLRYDTEVVRRKILAESPDIVGVTATTPLANQMFDISHLVKEISRDILTIGGGPHATALPEWTLEQSALDCVAFGEADDTILDILDNKPFEAIPGIAYRHAGSIRRTEPRALVRCLDDLAMPAWDLFPAEEYGRYVTRLMARRSPVAMIEFSRGCVFLCDFCGSKNTMGQGYRKKSPARCAEEMVYLQSIGYREVVLADDIFTSDNNWAMQVCEELIRAKVDMTWTCSNGIRVDSANTALFRAMKTAGCYRVHFGFESGNDQVLKAFGKGGRATLDQGVSAVDQAREAGLDTFGMFMLGLSEDTESSMQDTIDFAARVKVDALRFGITVPFPGTPMFHQAKREGRIKCFDWDFYTVYNDAEMLFDHKHLDWEVLKSFHHRSHREAMLYNPHYWIRRFIRAVRTLEILWDAYYFIKFLMISLSRKACSAKEDYRYRDRWDIPITEEAEFPDPKPQVFRGSTWRKEPALRPGPLTADSASPVQR